MSFQAMTWAAEQELPAMQKIVLLMMANRTNHDTGLCYPSHELLAKECGMAKRSLIEQINKLEAQGLLGVIRSINDKGVKNVNKYRLNLHIKANSGSAGDALRGSAGDALRGSEGDALGSAGDALRGSEGDALGSAGDALRGSAGDAHKPVTIEPVKEPTNISISDDDELTIEQLMEFKPDEIDCGLWRSVITARKKRKAVQTKRAIKGFIGELDECRSKGIGFEVALDIFLQKTWKGIRAEWIQQKEPRSVIRPFNQATKAQAISQRNQETMQRMMEKYGVEDAAS